MTDHQLPPQHHDAAGATGAATSQGGSPGSDHGMGSPEPSFDRATDASSNGYGGGVVGFPLRRFCARSGNTPVEFALIPADSPLVPSRTHGFPQDRRASAPALVTDPQHATHWNEDAADDGDGLETRQDSTVTVGSATSADGGDPAAPPSAGSSLPLHLHAHTEGFAADGPDDLILSLFELLIDPTMDGETSPGNLPVAWDFLRTLTRSELRDACKHGQQSASGPREFINGIAAAACLLCKKEADGLGPVSHVPGVIAIVAVRVFSRGKTSHSRRLAEQLRIFRQSHHTDWFARAGPHARVLYHLMIGSRGQRRWGATGMLLPITQDTIATQSQLLRGVEQTAPPSAWANWEVNPPGDLLVSDELGGGNLAEHHQQRSTSVPDDFVTNAIDELVKYRAIIQAQRPDVTGCSVPSGITRHRGDPPVLLHRIACHDVALLSEPEACRELCHARDDAWGSVLHFAACTGQVHWFRTWMMVLFGDRSTLTLRLPDNFQEFLCDREGRTVLDCAAASGSTRMFRHCLTNWSAWTCGVRTIGRVDALRLARHAAMGGCPEVLRMSLPSPTPVTTDELTLLVAHAALGDNFINIVETIRALCKPGMTSNTASLCALTSRLKERTPAHYAARGGNPESLRQACSLQGATYHVPDAHGCTIFHHALRSGKIVCVESAIDLMVRAKSSTRWRLWADNAGHLPIHFAAWSGNADLMEWVAKGGDKTRELLSRARGLKLLTTARSGATGIHFVARSGNVKLFESFRLEHQGAMRCWKPSQWSLLLEYAAAGGAPDMVYAVVNAASSAHVLQPQDRLPALRRRLTAMAMHNPGYPGTMTKFIASLEFEILYRNWAPMRG